MIESGCRASDLGSIRSKKETRRRNQPFLGPSRWRNAATNDSNLDIVIGIWYTCHVWGGSLCSSRFRVSGFAFRGLRFGVCVSGFAFQNRFRQQSRSELKSVNLVGVALNLFLIIPHAMVAPIRPCFLYNTLTIGGVRIDGTAERSAFRIRMSSGFNACFSRRRQTMWRTFRRELLPPSP